MEERYTLVERLVHRLAFASPQVQRAAEDIEMALYRGRVVALPATPPVFVTALPRAGTTLLLEALNEFPEVATHTYRDMPFVMAPLLWAQISRVFQKRAEFRERAHADGMLIGYDSPEAFEEIIWRTFWPSKYHKGRIDIWQADDGDVDAAIFFSEHFKKIRMLRAAAPFRARYVSKNNGNIARLAFLPHLFPGGTILVLLRDPVEHACSLWRQHRRFTALQREQKFVAEYMSDIGHYEFGSLHRPYMFPDIENIVETMGPDEPDYWLRYWLAAYRWVTAHAAAVRLVSYEGLCRAPRESLGNLADELGLARGPALEAASARVRGMPPARADAAAFDPALVECARALHADLEGMARPAAGPP